MKLHLIEGTSAFFRAYHATAATPVYADIGTDMGEGGGLPCNAIQQYARMLWRMMAMHKGSHMAVVLDGPSSRAHRQKMLPSYKTHRPEHPEDLRVQLPWMRPIAEMLGVPVLEMPGYEADDVIATLASWWQMAWDEAEIVIISIDKDFMQLANSRVSVFDPVRDTYVTAQDITKKFGAIPTHAIPDAQALIGDKVDGIPGVPGVGKVVAEKLLKQFGSLDGIYANLGKVEPVRIRGLLFENEANARLSYRLACLETNLGIRVTANDLERRAPSTGAGDMLRKFGLEELIAQMEGEPA